NGRDRITVGVLVGDRTDIAAVLVCRNGLRRSFFLASRGDRLDKLLAVLVYELLNDDIVVTVIVAEAVPFFRTVRNGGFHQVTVAPMFFNQIVIWAFDAQLFQLIQR